MHHFGPCVLKNLVTINHYVKESVIMILTYR